MCLIETRTYVFVLPNTAIDSFTHLERGCVRTAHFLRAALLLVLDTLQFRNALLVDGRGHRLMTLSDCLGRHANVRPILGKGSERLRKSGNIGSKK